MTTKRENIRSPEALSALADQVGAMRATFEDQDAPDRPRVSKVSRAYLRGAEDALRAAALGEDCTTHAP